MARKKDPVVGTQRINDDETLVLSHPVNPARILRRPDIEKCILNEAITVMQSRRIPKRHTLLSVTTHGLLVIDDLSTVKVYNRSGENIMEYPSLGPCLHRTKTL